MRRRSSFIDFFLCCRLGSLKIIFIVGGGAVWSVTVRLIFVVRNSFLLVLRILVGMIGLSFFLVITLIIARVSV